ncbi:MAG: Blue-light-activated protein [candidate division BRC1 bacterium ADurb.BinA364]|nr:MAG: Blue-light-activated protein [candidate division BRC1 bacterium ADurb.BinA364]
MFRDQTAERAAQRQLQRIEWMLQPGRGADAAARERFDSPYGDLSALNSSRTILNAVGPKLLESIVREGLDLLDTSAAVYEASGEYALGLFSSGWCRFLDQASRALCGCEDNAEALACGKWLCHESCWTRASKASIETGKPVDIECEGGIRLYAVPIRAGGEVLGSVNLGYGEPPRDPDTLRALAERFGVDAGELAAQAVCYESRPPFVIEIAKRRLEASALLIGEIVERHRAQELLKESQKSIERANELMSAVLDHTHVLTVCLDSRFNFIWVNRAYADTCKRSPDFFPGKNHFELYPHEESQAIFQRAADSGEPFYAYAKPFVFTDQPERGVTYWDWSLVPLKGDNGQTERLILSLADVTGRIRVELALRESEETHRALVEGIPDVVMRFDRDGRHLFVSENVEQVAGIPARRFIGKTHRELGFPEDLCRFWEEAIRQVFDSGEPHETEFSFAGPAGTAIFDWRLVPEFDAQNKAKSVLSISRDITAHRRAEENYETLFREMLDGFALHEIILDERGEPADYRFLAVNPAFERLTGLSAEALVGKTVLEALPGTEPHWIRTYGRVALTGEPAFFEDYHGELDKHFEVRAFRPGPNQFACIFADITARKRAEAERESMREQLEQARKMESVGRLAGGVAHDFNNMLGVILGYVEMVLEEVDSAVPMHADLQEIKRAAQRSADLTRQLLAFARKQTIAPKVLDLNETIGGTLNFLRRLIGESVELAWKPAEGLWPVKVDPTQIDQILTNLCANARDAIAAGPGSIFIETQNVVFDEEHRAAHADFAPGAFVMLAVADNGPGIPREVLKHVFEPFFTTKEVGQGTGLGLATVYGIAKQNNGFVHIYSEPGKGTIVKIYLPRYHGDGQAAPAAENESPRGRAETVLLVEDEAAILHMSKSMLEKLGYTVHAFGRPADAIQFAQRHVEKIDLLLTDVVMPEMNGRELADRIEAIAPGVKRLFMSGYTASAIAHHGILDEGLMLIHKPFSRGALARKVREALEANPGGAD